MRPWIVLWCLPLAACPADPDPATSGGSSDTGAPVTSTDSGGPGTTEMPTTMPTESTESTAAVDESTTAGDSSTGGDSSGSGSSTGAPCPVGAEGCPCDRGACEDGLMCDANLDICIGVGACPSHPEGEPNDDEMSAVDLGEVAGCVVGSIDGAIDQGDADWFTYHGTVDPDCNMDTSGLLDADPELPICMFWECDQGNEQVVCFGMPEAVSPEGRPGCCGPANNVVFMQRECLGVGDQPNGTVYMQVRGPDTGQCVDYELAYLF